MKVLITVEFYYSPTGGGIGEQARQIAEGLASKGHEVIVATSPVTGRPVRIKGVSIISFAVHGDAIKGISGDTEAYRNFLRTSDVEVMLNFAANVWTTDIAFQLVDSLTMRKVLSTPGLSKINNPQYNAYYREVYSSALKKYNHIIYTSSSYRDKKFGDEHGLGEKAVIIPNGASEEEFLALISADFRQQYQIRTPRMAITVANHYFAKGHFFIIKAWKMMRRKDATLVIVGHKPARHSWYSCYLICKALSLLTPRLKVVQVSTRELTLSAYKQADLFLFGSRLECAPLVLYESMAAGTPFITTNVGNVSDYANYVRIVDTPHQMASEANKLLNDDLARKRMADLAHKLWKEKYTWTAIVGQYENVLLDKACDKKGICRK